MTCNVGSVILWHAMRFCYAIFLSARSVGYVRISVGDTLAIHVLTKGVQKNFFKCMTE